MPTYRFEVDWQDGADVHEMTTHEEAQDAAAKMAGEILRFSPGRLRGEALRVVAVEIGGARTVIEVTMRHERISQAE